MQRALRTTLMASIITLATTTGAHAAGNFNAKLMLHALASTTKNVCTRAANIPTNCAGYDVGINNRALYPTVHYVYLMAINGSQTEGIAGVQGGVQYDGGAASGVDVFAWTLCATLEFSSTGWPNAGGGNLITWNTSGTQCTAPPGNATIGAVGVAGFFYLGAYTPDIMSVTPRPVDGLAKVANCVSTEDVVFSSPNDAQTFLGAVGFGRPGVNPCGRDLPPLAVQPSSWSGVKSLITN